MTAVDLTPLIDKWLWCIQGLDRDYYRYGFTVWLPDDMTQEFVYDMDEFIDRMGSFEFNSLQGNTMQFWLKDEFAYNYIYNKKFKK